MALLNKVAPNLEATSEPVQFTLDVTEGLSSTGAQALQRVAEASVPVYSGSQLLSSLIALAKMQEVDDLTKRIEALERQ